MDYAALGTAFLAWLKTISPWLHDVFLVWVGAMVQKDRTEGQEAKDTLQALGRADEAARPVKFMSHAEVITDLRNRGKLRD